MLPLLGQFTAGVYQTSPVSIFFWVKRVLGQKHNLVQNKRTRKLAHTNKHTNELSKLRHAASSMDACTGTLHGSQPGSWLYMHDLRTSLQILIKAAASTIQVTRQSGGWLKR